MMSHYLNPIVISLIILGLLIWQRNLIISKTGKLWWMHIVGFVAIYITLVWVVFCVEVILNIRLQEFDLNNDGIFTSDEQTLEQKEITKRIAHDTARKFIIYTGIVYSAIITIVLFLFDLFIIHVWSKYIKKTTG